MKINIFLGSIIHSVYKMKNSAIKIYIRIKATFLKNFFHSADLFWTHWKKFPKILILVFQANKFA